MAKAKTFAARLIAAREAKGLSRNELARIADLTRQTMSNLERGIGKPTWETVQALARALGVSCEEFVTPPPVDKKDSAK